MKSALTGGMPKSPAHYLRSARHLASQVFAQVLRPGDRAVDATLGTGQDCVQLCNLVGEDGLVYGFDVQQEAIDKTRERLLAQGLSDRAVLLHTGHENMAVHVSPGVRLVAFNLGWLPGGDKHQTTTVATTMAAIQQALLLLKVPGVLAICCYPGHPEGQREQQAILDFASGLSPQAYTVLWHQFLNGGPGTPGCLVIEKIREENQ